MTKATTTNAIQPQMAVLRCWAHHRPMRVAIVLVCTGALLERSVDDCRGLSSRPPAPTMRPPGVSRVQVALTGSAASTNPAYGLPPQLRPAGALSSAGQTAATVRSAHR